jgi:hypothetical protein
MRQIRGTTSLWDTGIELSIVKTLLNSVKPVLMLKMSPFVSTPFNVYFSFKYAKRLEFGVVWPLGVLELSLVPWLPWVTDCQASSWTVLSPAPPATSVTPRTCRGNYMTTITACCWSTTLGPGGIQLVLDFLPSQVWRALCDPAAISTQVRGRPLPLMAQPKACDWSKNIPSFAWRTATIGVDTYHTLSGYISLWAAEESPSCAAPWC